MECISTYWENKGKYLDDLSKEGNVVQDLWASVVKTLKHFTSELLKIEEIFNLEAYKIWIQHQKQLTDLFSQIHTKGGAVISKTFAKKILDEMLYIAGDESRLTKIEKEVITN